MNYETFKQKITALVAKADETLNVRFFTDEGKYLAKVSDGTTITGNAKSLKIGVNWGSGHLSTVKI